LYSARHRLYNDKVNLHILSWLKFLDTFFLANSPIFSLWYPFNERAKEIFLLKLSTSTGLAKNPFLPSIMVSEAPP